MLEKKRHIDSIPFNFPPSSVYMSFYLLVRLAFSLFLFLSFFLFFLEGSMFEIEGFHHCGTTPVPWINASFQTYQHSNGLRVVFCDLPGPLCSAFITVATGKLDVFSCTFINFCSNIHIQQTKIA